MDQYDHNNYNINKCSLVVTCRGHPEMRMWGEDKRKGKLLITLRVCAPFPTREHSAPLLRLWWQKSPLGLASWALGSSLFSRGTVFLKVRASSGSGPCWSDFCSESKFFFFHGGKKFETASLGEMGDAFSRICWTQALKPTLTGRPGNYSGQLRWAPIKSHLHPLWTIKHLRSVCWMILML